MVIEMRKRRRRRRRRTGRGEKENKEKKTIMRKRRIRSGRKIAGKNTWRNVSIHMLYTKVEYKVVATLL
jgi:hypothetical protein